MLHRIVTCKNHPDLRWSTKEIAWTDGVGYNGCRNIFFNGRPNGKGLYFDGSGLECSLIDENNKAIMECSCPSSDLIIAPEDALLKRD